MHAVTTAVARCCTSSGGSLTILGWAACSIPKHMAVCPGSMGRSSEHRDGGGAFPVVMVLVTLCTCRILLSR